MTSSAFTDFVASSLKFIAFLPHLQFLPHITRSLHYPILPNAAPTFSISSPYPSPLHSLPFAPLSLGSALPFPNSSRSPTPSPHLQSLPHSPVNTKCTGTLLCWLFSRLIQQAQWDMETAQLRAEVRARAGCKCSHFYEKSPGKGK